MVDIDMDISLNPIPSATFSAYLPDELVTKILSPLFFSSETKFFDVSLSLRHIPNPNHYSRATYLLVCKQWLRVATPSLYHQIVLKSQAQAEALSQSLQNNPALGLLVKGLRLEGGFGDCMEAIIVAAPNLCDLTLTLGVWQPDSASGLTRVLQRAQNIRRLGLRAWARIPVYSAEYLNQVAQCIEQDWHDLQTIHCPYSLCFYGSRSEQILKDAISRVSHPLTICVPGPLYQKTDTLREILRLREHHHLMIDQNSDSVGSPDQV